jgi:hypothetical protein
MKSLPETEELPVLVRDLDTKGNLRLPEALQAELVW